MLKNNQIEQIEIDLCSNETSFKLEIEPTRYRNCEIMSPKELGEYLKCFIIDDGLSVSVDTLVTIKTHICFEGPNGESSKDYCSEIYAALHQARLRQ